MILGVIVTRTFVRLTAVAVPAKAGCEVSQKLAVNPDFPAGMCEMVAGSTRHLFHHWDKTSAPFCCWFSAGPSWADTRGSDDRRGRRFETYLAFVERGKGAGTGFAFGLTHVRGVHRIVICSRRSRPMARSAAKATAKTSGFTCSRLGSSISPRLPHFITVRPSHPDNTAKR